MANWMGRTALELMGQAGLGYSFDPLTAEPKDKFGEALKLIVYVLFIPHCYQRMCSANVSTCLTVDEQANYCVASRRTTVLTAVRGFRATRPSQAHCAPRPMACAAPTY